MNSTSPNKKEDCKDKNKNFDYNNILNSEEIYDMKKFKEDVGLPLHPPSASPPNANGVNPNNNTKTENQTNETINNTNTTTPATNSQQNINTTPEIQRLQEQTSKTN